MRKPLKKSKSNQIVSISIKVFKVFPSHNHVVFIIYIDEIFVRNCLNSAANHLGMCSYILYGVVETGNLFYMIISIELMLNGNRLVVVQY